MINPLLMTKLFPPPARGALVARPRLAERLLIGIREGRKLLLVSAPAGFGKTTLVAEAVQQNGLPTAWYSLDDADNDLNRFWRYVVAAFRRLVPQVGELAQAMLEANQPPPIENTLTTLLNDLAGLQERVLLVLDDYHMIDNQAVHDSLNFFLNHMSGHVVVALTTRSDPPLSLARRRGRLEMVEVRASDLRLTRVEALDFVNTVMKVGLNPGDLDVLLRRTEGWVAGLQMAVLAMQGLASETEPEASRMEHLRQFVSSFAGDDHYIGDYLIEEVLQRQPKHIQEFLLHTSLLEKFCAGLCADFLAGVDEVVSPLSEAVPALDQSPAGSQQAIQAILSYLEHANLFLIPLDNRQEWFRYHRLFAELLQHRLAQARSLEYQQQLHLKASAWYERNGYWNEAIDHAIRSGDPTLPYELIERGAIEMFLRSELLTVREWILRMPEAEILARPALCVNWGWAALSTGYPAETERALAGLQQFLNLNLDDGIQQPPADLASGLKLLWVNVLLLRTSLDLDRGDLITSRKRVETILTMLDNLDPELVKISHDMRSVALFDLGLVLEYLGELEPAGAALREAVEYSVLSKNLHILPMALSHLAQIHWVRGELKLAQETYRQALSRASDLTGKPSPLISVAHAGLGLLAYEFNQPEEARACFERVISLAKPFNNWESLLPAYLGLAKVLGCVQKKEEALAVLDEAQQTWQRAKRTEELDTIRAWKGIISANKTVIRAVSAQFDQASYNSSTLRNFVSENELHLQVRLYLLIGDVEKARVLLDRAYRAGENGGRWGLVVQNLVLQSVVYEMSSQTPAALDCLGRALKLAEPGGYLRTFIDEGQIVERLLNKIAASPAEYGVSVEYVSCILNGFANEVAPTTGEVTGPEKTFAGQPHLGQAGSEPYEALTGREVEILAWVAAGLTNSEIAARLFISAGTVKVHTNNIYAKLNVNSRTAAVARARALGLIP